MSKKLLATLALVAMLGLASCGKLTGTTEETATGTTSTEETTATGTEAAASTEETTATGTEATAE